MLSGIWKLPEWSKWFLKVIWILEAYVQLVLVSHRLNRLNFNQLESFKPLRSLSTTKFSDNEVLLIKFVLSFQLKFYWGLFTEVSLLKSLLKSFLKSLLKSTIEVYNSILQFTYNSIRQLSYLQLDSTIQQPNSTILQLCKPLKSPH